VFDDSFSALDYATDAHLREALSKRAGDSSVIMVGQRIATIMHADEIIVLDEGRVVGRGTHHDLLRECPTYLEIAESQLSARELGLEGGEA
jgi:ATP-binding cassette subfamily B protein